MPGAARTALMGGGSSTSSTRILSESSIRAIGCDGAGAGAGAAASVLTAGTAFDSEAELVPPFCCAFGCAFSLALEAAGSSRWPVDVMCAGCDSVTAYLLAHPLCQLRSLAQD